MTGYPLSGLAIGVGIGFLILLGLGAWIGVVNLRFGFQVERLGRRLAEDDGLPDLTGISCEQALAELEEAPSDWRYWFRLGRAYQRAGDPTRGKRAIQQAVRLSARSGDGSRATSA